MEDSRGLSCYSGYHPVLVQRFDYYFVIVEPDLIVNGISGVEVIVLHTVTAVLSYACRWSQKR